MKTIQLKIKGMTCPSCSVTVERQLNELDGILDKYINHVTDSGKITFDDTLVSEKDIIAKINEGHYKVAGFENITNAVEVPECPTCHQSGQFVPNTVFKSNLKPELFKQIDHEKKHFACMNPTCRTAYYSGDFAIPFTGLKRELWYKSYSRQKVICYCNNIDREQIKVAVQEQGLKTWEDIIGLYRKKPIEKCESLNPTGLCCRDKFDEVVQKFEN